MRRAQDEINAWLSVLIRRSRDASIGATQRVNFPVKLCPAAITLVGHYNTGLLHPLGGRTFMDHELPFQALPIYHLVNLAQTSPSACAHIPPYNQVRLRTRSPPF